MESHIHRGPKAKQQMEAHLLVSLFVGCTMQATDVDVL